MYLNKNNKSIDEDELLQKFKESQFDGCIMCDDSWDDKETCAKKCVNVAVQYHQSKMEEINKIIVTQIDYCTDKKINNNRLFLDAQIASLLVLQQKIKSL